MLENLGKVTFGESSLAFLDPSNFEIHHP